MGAGMEEYDYPLPAEAIAQEPAEPRESARLLVAGAGGLISHRHVRDLPDLLEPGDVLVVNETRVLPARLHLRKPTGGQVEVLLLEPLQGNGHSEAAGDVWSALVRRGKRVAPGTRLSAGATELVEVGERGEGGTREVRLLAGLAGLAPHATVALPPYIHEPLDDAERYQTVYAARPGSVAAPTAGLHLSHDVLDRCRRRGVELHTVDLTVGLDTFRPITADRPEDHVMHAERYSVPESTMEACRQATGRVVAVGTTTVRALESAAATGELSGRTRLFIHDDYPFQVVDVLLTNFHVPRSSLLLLLAAFYGPGWRTLYDEALTVGYRFLSFGDAMLIPRTGPQPRPPRRAGDPTPGRRRDAHSAGHNPLTPPPPLRLDIVATDGAARAATVTTTRGAFDTPCFMPVGTRGGVRGVAADDLHALGATVILANTYHLMLRPGTDVVETLGGVHGFAAWPGHVLTDSGGFQVFSLRPEVDDDGVSFASTYDGSPHRLTPEDAVAIQERLGADIAMVLDVCPPLPSSPEVLRLAVDRTAAWAERSKAARREHTQALFGIVQGGVDQKLRTESAGRTVEIGFDGYAIGGLSVGEGRTEMLDSLAAAVEQLPPDKPRYLMGVGDPVGLVAAIGLGVDMFDCVLPTRLARHGTVLSSEGRFHLTNAAFARHQGPLDPACGCAVCTRWSRAFLRHLLQTSDPTAARLISIHNLSWTLALVGGARRAITERRLAAFQTGVEAVWPL